MAPVSLGAVPLSAAKVGTGSVSKMYLGATPVYPNPPSTLQFAHGAIQWASTDTVGTVYTVSGLAFQPKALRVYALGLSSAVDAASGSQASRRSLGVATSPTDRQCVASRDNHGAVPTEVSRAYRNDCVVCVITATSGATDGLLDLGSLTADGFTLVVDDQVTASLTVFWEAWGGAALTAATTVYIPEPTATGNQDYTVPGFTAAGTDQVVLFAGGEAAGGTAPVVGRGDGVLMVGYATSAAAQVVAFGGSRNAGSAFAVATDRYAISGQCLANKADGARTVTARASLTQWNTNGFRLNWAEVSGAVRHYVALALKGGRWAAGELTLNVTALNNVATVSGLPFAPTGLCLVSHVTPEQASDTATSYDVLTLGTASAPTARRAMFAQSDADQSTAKISLAIEYDAVLINVASGVTNILVDLNTLTADGFQLIVDDPEAPYGTIWIGYLAFGT